MSETTVVLIKFRQCYSYLYSS